MQSFATGCYRPGRQSHRESEMLFKLQTQRSSEQSNDGYLIAGLVHLVAGGEVLSLLKMIRKGHVRRTWALVVQAFNEKSAVSTALIISDSENGFTSQPAGIAAAPRCFMASSK